MFRISRTVLVAALTVVLFHSSLPAGDVLLTDPNYPKICATALDQPELSVVLVDPNTGQVLYDPNYQMPVIFDAFIDTGASSFVISYLQARGYGGMVLSLELDGSPSGEFVGQWTEIGIGGSELGDVTKPYGVRVLNGQPGMAGEIDLPRFTDYGEHGLWVRRQAGIGEDILGFPDPVNIVGMPVISQAVMVMDPTPLVNLDRMATHLYSPNDPNANIPNTNITFGVRMRDFVDANRPGETPPSSWDNPLVQGISIGYDDGSAFRSDGGNEWLFDTGASGSFIDFARAKAIGLVPDFIADPNEFIVYHESAGGPTTEVGGIGGGTVVVPIVTVDEIRIAAAEGFDVVWPNVDVMIMDLGSLDPNGLDGVFGMNLLVPAWSLHDGHASPGYFDTIVFDVTGGDPNDPLGYFGEVRLFSDMVPEPATLSLLAIGACALLKRRRR